MQRRQHLEQERQEGAPPAPPEHQEAERSPAEDFASSIGNQAMTRVAESRELQQSPGARDLMGAQAYTGRDSIAFDTPGAELVGHEVAHVVQQGSGRVADAEAPEDERE